MKRLAAVGAAVAWALVLSSCATTGKPEDQIYTLSLDLQPGTSYPFSTEVKQKIDEEVLGQKISLEQTMKTLYTVSVDSTDSQGNTSLTVTYNDMSVTVDNVSSDGDLGDISGALGSMGDEMNQLYDALEGRTFGVVLSPEGRVQSVSGMEDMIQAMKEWLSASGTPGADQIFDQVSGLFGDEFITQSWEYYFAYLPEEPVKIGDTWTANLSTGSQFPLNVATVYTLESVTDGTARIGVKGTVTAGKDSALMEVSGLQLGFTFDGTETGQVTVDLESGWLDSMIASQTVDGKITISGDAGGNIDFEIPLHLDMTTRVNQ